MREGGAERERGGGEREREIRERETREREREREREGGIKYDIVHQTQQNTTKI